MPPAILDGHPVPSPLFISGRLMAAFRIGGVGTLHLHSCTRDAEDRAVYSWAIDGADGKELGLGAEDIRSGSGSPVDYIATMGTLLGFLGACAESYPDGENADLFDTAVAEWAIQHSDELAMALCELEELP